MKRFEEVDQLENGTSSTKIIEIRSVFKTGKHTVQPAFDPKAGWYAGVERLSDEEKKKRSYYITVGEQDSPNERRSHLNTKLKLENGVVFNLNDDIDAINWAWIKHLPCIAMSFKEAQMSKALFYVHIEGREAEANNSRSEDMFNAMRYIMDDSPSELSNRALILGMDLVDEPDATVKEYLLGVAKKTPMKILHAYRDKGMKINLLFAKGKRAGLIVTSPSDGTVRYGMSIIGTSDDSAIAYLQQNTDLLDLLEKEVEPEYFARQEQKLTPAARAAKAREAKGSKEK